MEKVWVLLLLSFALAESFSKRGIFINLENGDMCLQNAQCKSDCCHRASMVSLLRCADKATEKQECSPKNIYGFYYKCPCVRGLTCEGNRTVVGMITNSDTGICRKPAQ